MKLLAKRKHVTSYCDFCGKSDDDVTKMVDGKYAFICNECVDRAAALIQPVPVRILIGPYEVIS